MTHGAAYFSLVCPCNWPGRKNCAGGEKKKAEFQHLGSHEIALICLLIFEERRESAAHKCALAYGTTMTREIH
jgi:hypothetical protein